MSKPLSRRRFILTTTAGTFGLAASQTKLAHAALLTTPPPLPTDPSELYTLSRSLTEVWAKKLLDLQALDASRPQEYGGIL